MRVKGRITWIVLCLLLVILASGVSYRSYLRALAWHMRNGQYVRFGGHQLTLPPLWWEAGRSGYESPFLLRAIGAHNSGWINVIWIPVERAPREGTDLQEEEDLEISRFAHDGKSLHMSKCVIKTRSQDLYCVRTGTPPHFYAIQCQAYGLQYLITSTGDYATEKEAEEIFSTLQ